MQVHVTWNYEYLFLSLFVSFLGTYLASTLSEHFRISKRIPALIIGTNINRISIATTISAISVWSMHFIALGGVIFTSPDGAIIQKRFNVSLSMISLLSCIIFVCIGVTIAGGDRIFSRDRADVFKMLLEDTESESIKNIQSMTVLWRIALFKGLEYVLLGAIVASFGCCFTYYLSLKSLKLNNVEMSLNIGMLIAGIIVAVIVFCAEFWTKCRILSLRPEIESLRFFSSAITTVGIYGVYRIIFASVVFDYQEGGGGGNDGPRSGEEASVDEDLVFDLVVLACAFCWVVVAGVFADMSNWNNKLLEIVDETGELFSDMTQIPTLGRDSFLRAYYDVRRKLRDTDNKFQVKFCQLVNVSRASVFTSYAEEEVLRARGGLSQSHDRDDDRVVSVERSKSLRGRDDENVFEKSSKSFRGRDEENMVDDLQWNK